MKAPWEHHTVKLKKAFDAVNPIVATAIHHGQYIQLFFYPRIGEIFKPSLDDCEKISW